ncbi:kinesin-like protein KIN-6 [Zingiber officinale]|uniref:kinesin-like protein KIN-6 n=1 Tax=Zingiber officinale TaxID=94328 RepID=UPI001C4C83C6|nr:kinesin-like protein KIN-6 [Zingiber officinale]
MESPPSPCPPSTVRRNPPRRAKKAPCANTLPASASVENLNVFLRIRPLQVLPQVLARKPPKVESRANGKGGARKVDREKTGECLTVNGPSSVTLLAPSSLLDSKRIKNELYDGFSYVFPSDSSQKEVYDMVANPLVMDFMRGKNALLVALGPTGSGKTYTMFGCAKDPGIVPLTLKQVFRCKSQDDHHAMRSYYMSIFEIYSEGGKGEKILDLSGNGVGLTFQNSTLIGLKEVMVSNIEEAENLLALSMLKRSTAATNANEQSSRSQCIINIRSADNSLREQDYSSDGAVLTIVDLAGAEKERKTGNQGARLMESSFINNTSMVFGQCLRSLLEHQKNPKKPLEKHFKNSLLTRYLKDYMEGKKRMALILTVKLGEDDYSDTSFLLRQASPYMKIKFTCVEELLIIPSKKRSTSSLVDHCKRRKINVSETLLDVEAESANDRNEVFNTFEEGDAKKQLQEMVVPQSSSISPEIIDAPTTVCPTNDELLIELQRRARSDEIMRNFSKALWTVLKQYKQKLIESEKNVHNLSEAFTREENQVIKLKKELEELRSYCSCHRLPVVGESSSLDLGPVLDCCGSDLLTTSQINSSNIRADFHSGDSVTLVDQMPASLHGETLIQEDFKVLSDCGPSCTSGLINDSDITGGCSSPLNSIMDNESNFPPPSVKEATHLEENSRLTNRIDNLAGETHIHNDIKEMLDCSTRTTYNLTQSDRVTGNSSPLSKNGSSSLVGEITYSKENERLSKPDLLQVQHAKSIDKYHQRRILKEKNGVVSKSAKADKPKRRLLPASTMLLKEMTGLDIEAGNQDIRGKTTKGEQGIAQNHDSLFNLLRKQS